MSSTLAPHHTPALGPEVTVGPPIRRLGQTVHVVRDVRSDGYFQVSPREAFVLEQLDGTRTFGQVGQDYRERFGKALGDASWQQLLGLLHARRLLIPPGEDGATGAAAYSALREQNRAARTTPGSPLRVRVPLLDPEDTIAALRRRAGWLMRPTAAVLTVTAVLLMLVVIGLQLPALVEGYSATWREQPVGVVAGFAYILATLVVHEFAHGVTCVWFGGRCREMGISWRFPLVTVYTKVEDIYLVPLRWQRVVVSLSGVLAGMAALLPAFVVWLLVPTGHPVSDASVVVLLFGSVVQLVNLAPFLGLDGQKALSHALGVWDVAAESRAWWTARLRGRSPQTDTAGAAGWVVPVYGLVVVVLLSLLTAWVLWVAWSLLVAGEVPW